MKSYTLDCNGASSSSDLDAMQNFCVETFSPSSQCPRWMVALRQTCQVQATKRASAFTMSRLA